MTVGLDAQLALGTATGIGEYINGITATFAVRTIKVVSLQQPRLDPWRFDRRVIWDQLLLPIAARRSRIDILHCAAGTMPLVHPAPIVVTVHDVAWLRAQAHARSYARTYFGPFSLAQYRRARRVIVDSNFSRRELVALAPSLEDRIDVIYPGVAEDFTTLQRTDGQQKPSLILAVGTIERRKNLAVVIRALSALPNVRLIVAGPSTPYRAECEQLATDLRVTDQISYKGYIPRTHLLALYATAAVAVVPSYYEGFGYGAAQALCAGIPLIAANTSSLPEVVRDAAPLLDPDNTTAWTTELATILAHPLEAQVRATAARSAAIHRFAWSTAAQAIENVYQKAIP